MNEKALKVFLENYENKGMCDGLEKHIKTIEKEFKKSGITKSIKYLPWAVVERIFRMQGGTIEVLDWKYNIPFTGEDFDALTGEKVVKDKDNFFLHLKGTWQGETLEEFYPIFDNQTSKVVRTPDAQQLNTSRQRGSVRLISRLSGIGLWIFEQQDDQFDESKDNEEITVIDKKGKAPQETKIITKESLKQVPKQEVKQDTKQEVKQDTKQEVKKAKSELKEQAMLDVLGIIDDEENEEVEKEHFSTITMYGEDESEEEEQGMNMMDLFQGNIVKNTKPTPTPTSTPTQASTQAQAMKKIPQKQGEKEEDYPQGTEQHSDILVKVKGYVKTHKKAIIDFKNKKGKELLGDLSYLELKELLKELEEEI